MSIINQKDFIDFYSIFYYENSYSKDVKKEFGIPIDLKTAKNIDKPTAEIIIVKKLKNGIYDSSSIAWKLGTEIKNNGDVDYRYYHFKANDIKKFCERLHQSYNESILKSYKPAEDRNELYMAIRDLYSKILRINLDTNLPGNRLGAVQIINSIYFLSAGKAPIYDQYAHKAILALNYGISPKDILLESEFNKKNIDTVICMYKDYLTLLEKQFPDNIYLEQNQYINRDLDQALWVYGHCESSWYEVKEKAHAFLNNLGS